MHFKILFIYSYVYFGPCNFAFIYFSFFNPEMKYRKCCLFFNGSNWWIKQSKLICVIQNSNFIKNLLIDRIDRQLVFLNVV